MRLVLKQNGQIVKEFQFTRGPVYIGRHTDSHIFLRDRTVSRHHAVIFGTQDGTWMVEDLDSANKTYLNDQPIHKAKIKTGDRLRITDFTIEIYLENGGNSERPISLEDTLSKTAYSLQDTLTKTSYAQQQIIVRRPDAEHVPDIKFPAKRAKAFAQATEQICKADGPEQVLAALLRIAAKQFSPYHVWCGLRNQPAGPISCHAGKERSGKTVQLSEIKFSEKVTEALEKGQFLLLPRVLDQKDVEKINSVMIAPIKGQGGCFGVIYIDNAMDHERYTLGDMDYLILLAIHTATVLENF